MLKQRIVTALVLLAILLPALFATSPWPFAALTLLLVAAAGWEWARLNGLAGNGALLFGSVLAALCVLTWLAGLTTAVPAAIWWLAMLAWVLGGAHVLRRGVPGWPQMPRAARLLLGLLLLWTAWLALVAARSLGLNFILSLFCVVWMADVAAYFGGRAFGKRKLAPAISPGKSWAGVYSGMAGTVVLAVVWLLVDRQLLVGAESASWFSIVAARIGIVAMLFAVLFLAAMSVVGDLVESLVKRSAGAKDSSALLPGHGGVLDRIDALLPVLPLALVFASL
ncbi:phosphatidate cytidylyltransferase [Piscinibacter sakaiensis]|uniref:phosphatidate cytidylyltransferase n=1 Tax=Piscinibacter sakaiensis TaxID=1547922 RepID=UPI003AADE9CB